MKKVKHVERFSKNAGGYYKVRQYLFSAFERFGLKFQLEFGPYRSFDGFEGGWFFTFGVTFICFEFGIHAENILDEDGLYTDNGPVVF